MLTPEHKAAVNKFTASHNGKRLDRKAMVKPNPLVAKILVARIASMTDAQRQAIKTIVTPQSGEALKVLLPELSQLIDKGISNG